MSLLFINAVWGINVSEYQEHEAIVKSIQSQMSRLIDLQFSYKCDELKYIQPVLSRDELTVYTYKGGLFFDSVTTPTPKKHRDIVQFEYEINEFIVGFCK